MKVLNTYQNELVSHYLHLMRNKLGISIINVSKDSPKEDENDLALISEFMRPMKYSQLVHTLTWCQCGQIDAKDKQVSLREGFVVRDDFDIWFTHYQQRVGKSRIG